MEPIYLYPTHTHAGYRFRPGRVFPFGATPLGGGVNFSIYSSHATACTLVLFEQGQARPLVEKYFGAIPAGPVNHPAMASVPTLPRARSIAMKDHVATTIIQRYWAVPGLLDKRLAAIDIRLCSTISPACSRLVIKARISINLRLSSSSSESGSSSVR